MAKPRLLTRLGTPITWAASGSINVELSPVPFTILGLALHVRLDVTTTTATNFNDGLDRIISRLNLSGNIGGVQRTAFDFSNMRLPYHWSRKVLGAMAPRRPTAVADSATNALVAFAYVIPFGVQPLSPNGLNLNHRDLTVGIPRVDRGQLTLTGTFGTATAAGTNVTVNSGQVDIYAWGIEAEAGDSEWDFNPRAYPVMTMRSPAISATSTVFATNDPIAAGGFLRRIAIMLTRGTNYPRDRQVLNSIRVYNQVANREVVAYGGQAGSGGASGGDYEIAELVTQAGLIVPGDDANTLGVPTVAGYRVAADAGLVFIDLGEAVGKGKGSPLFGADLRGVANGDLRLDYGVNNATTVIMDELLQRYELEARHPANASILS